ncbi:MAG: TRAP transporter small permease [Limimaricola soesokkakensis]|uniref:TRAP transporter small permease n=1 Tax=Limimaricola soesokkakensis TaxID=1343159 RepID=UPI0040585021
MPKPLAVAGLAIKTLAALGVAAYAAAALVTVGDVLGRQVGLPIIGVVDLVQLFVMAGTWLVMPHAFLAAAHVGVDFLISRLPRRARHLLHVMAALVALILLALMLWQGFATFETRTMFGDSSQQLGIPIAWYWYPLLLGLGLCLPGVMLWLVAALREASDE